VNYSAAAHDPATEVDEAFYNLIEELTEKHQRGEPIDGQALLQAYPHYADRLQFFLPALEVLADLGRSGASAPARLGADEPAPIAGVLGDFRIVREIGRGGMGVVYEAEQVSLRRRVALKVLPFAAVLDERHLQRFRTEAVAAAQLHHTNIVPVFAVGCDRGVHYYAMQYIEGRTLGEVLRQLRGPADTGDGPATVPHDGHPLPTADRAETSTLANLSTDHSLRSPRYFRTIAELGIQAAEALECAHQQGITHRDIKPSNLILDVRGRLWVADFGLARVENETNLTLTGELVGTLRYMSPEQVEPEQGTLDHRADIYSLGATLYELLTLEPAFGEARRPALLRQILQEDPRPPRRLDDTIPPELETIALKALEKNSADRYPSAQALADDLRRFLEHRPLAARRPSLWERFRKWRRRNQTFVTSATVLLVLASIGFSVASALVIQARNKALYERRLRTQQEAIAQAGQAAKRLNDYVMHINLAAQAWSESQIEVAKARLLRCLPHPAENDLRGVEWRYLWRLCHSLPPPFAQHQGAAYTARFTHDGQRLATGGQDGARIWDYATGKQLAWLRDHEGDVNWISFSADDRRMATFGDDQKVRIWNTATWRVTKTFPEAAGGEFSPTGKILAVGEWRRGAANFDHLEDTEVALTFFDTTDWQRLGECEGAFPAPRGSAFSPDASQFAIISWDRRLRIWDVNSRRLITARADFPPLTDVAFSPTQPLLIVAEQQGGLFLCRWTGAGALEDSRFGNLVDQAESVDFTADGRRLLAAGRHRTMQLWEFLDDPRAAPVAGAVFHDETPLWCVRAAPQDGAAVTTGENGTVRKWDLDGPPECRRQLTSLGAVDALAFTPQSEKLVAMGTGGVGVYDPWSLKELARFNRVGQHTTSMALSRSGQWIAIGWEDGNLHQWDSAAYALVREFTPSELMDKGDQGRFGITALAFFAEDRGMTVGRYPTAALFLDPFTGKRLPALPIHRRDAYGYMASPDGRWIALAVNGKTEVWDAAGRRLQFTAPGDVAAFSPDGELLACVADRSIVHVWRTADATELATFATNSGLINALAFSADGRTLATANEERTVKLWSVAAGRELLTLADDMPNLRAVAFSPDGNLLAAAGALNESTGDLRVWRMDAGSASEPSPPKN
jgi:serine/threonine protein kinase/WD40 repeat protein